MNASLLTVLAADAYPNGKIQGGWEYVWSAYAVVWTLLILYAASLWFRRPKAPSQARTP